MTYWILLINFLCINTMKVHIPFLCLSFNVYLFFLNLIWNISQTTADIHVKSHWIIYLNGNLSPFTVQLYSTWLLLYTFLFQVFNYFSCLSFSCNMQKPRKALKWQYFSFKKCLSVQQQSYFLLQSWLHHERQCLKNL